MRHARYCFVRLCVDDAMSVEVKCMFRGGSWRCLLPSVSLASDDFRLFGIQHETDPPRMADRKAIYILDGHKISRLTLP